MMKMMILAPRRAGMSHAEFRRYVVDVHGPLVKSIVEVAADIRHYHYNFPVAGAGDRAFGHPVAELDIVTQGFFDSREAQLQNMRHPRFMQYLRPDESNFADTARALMHYTDEHEVWPGSMGPAKLFVMRRRAPGLSRSEFQSRWASEFPPLLEGLPLRGVVTRYVQNYVQAEAHHPEGSSLRYFDLIDEFWLSSLDAFDSLAQHGANAAEPIRRLEAECLQVDRTKAFVAEMVPNIP